MAPSEPRVQLIKAFPTSVEVEWTYSDTNHASVAQQILTISPDGGITWDKPVRMGNTRMGRIGGLQSNSKYCLRVKGKDKSGWGDFGPYLTFNTVAPCKPDAPQVVITRLAQTSFTVAWGVEFDGGAPILSYYIQLSKGGIDGSCYEWDKPIKRTALRAPDGTPYFEEEHKACFEGLEAFKLYGVRVQAQTRAGKSEWMLIDVTTQEYSVEAPSNAVTFWWEGPWCTNLEWYSGNILEIFHPEKQRVPEDEVVDENSQLFLSSSKWQTGCAKTDMWQTAAVAGPFVAGANRIRGLVYRIQSVDYPQYVVDVPFEKVRRRHEGDPNEHLSTMRRILAPEVKHPHKPPSTKAPRSIIQKEGKLWPQPHRQARKGALVEVRAKPALRAKSYTCDYGCGFKGIFDVVRRHEKSCKKVR
jgi:hypothetical protein